MTRPRIESARCRAVVRYDTPSRLWAALAYWRAPGEPWGEPAGAEYHPSERQAQDRAGAVLEATCPH